MFGTIIVLLAMILITPNLLGRPAELASIPVLIVAMTHDQARIIVDVTAAVQAYLYDKVALEVNHVMANGTNVTLVRYSQNDTYNVETEVAANGTPFWIHTRLVDAQGNYFEYNLSVRTFQDPNNGYKLTMAFTFPDDPGTATRYAASPGDFRWPVPRRGMVP